MADSGFGITLTFSSSFCAEIISFEHDGITRDAIETTHTGTSGGKRTFIPSDLIDYGELNVGINFAPGVDPPIDSAAENITITFPNSDASTWAFSGFMTNFRYTAPLDDRMTAECTIKVTGDVTVTL